MLSSSSADMYCPHCHREISSVAQFCRFCGKPVLLSQSPFRIELDKKGRRIPREYPETFSRDQFCWDGLVFGAFFALSKGMVLRGILYIVFIVSSIIFGSYAIDLEKSINKGSMQELYLVIGSMLSVGLHCGFTGYRAYCNFLEKTDPLTVKRRKNTGAGLTIILALVSIPFVIMLWLGIVIGLNA